MNKIKILREQIAALTTELRTFLDNKDVEKAKEKREEIRQAKELLKIEEEIAEEEKRILMGQAKQQKGTNGNISNRNMDKRAELRATAKLILRKSLTEEERALVSVQGNTALLPQGYINEIEIYRKGFPALKPYCHVIPVTNKNGSMPTASLGKNTLVNLSSDEPIPEGSMTTSPINYNVEDYGKFVPIEKDLEDDAAVDLIQSILLPDFAEGSVNAENAEIIKIVKANAVTVVGKDYTDVEKAIDSIVPAAQAGVITLTNTTGYCYLKNQKDKQGRSLNLITDVDGVKFFNGKPLIYLDDSDIVPVTEGNLIFYTASLRELVKFFDRKGIVIDQSREFLFNKNQDCIRAIERFDTEKGNARSVKVIEFKEA